MPRPYMLEGRTVSLLAHPVPHRDFAPSPMVGEWVCGPPSPDAARTAPGVVGISFEANEFHEVPPARPTPHTWSPLEALWWPPVRSGGIALWWLMHPARCRALWWLWPGGRRKEERGGPQAGSHAAAAATSRRHAPVEHLAPTPPRKAFKSQPEPPRT